MLIFHQRLINLCFRSQNSPLQATKGYHKNLNSLRPTEEQNAIPFFDALIVLYSKMSPFRSLCSAKNCCKNSQERKKDCQFLSKSKAKTSVI